MGGRGIGKKKARATVFSLVWMNKTIDGEPNRTWLKEYALLSQNGFPCKDTRNCQGQ